MVTPITFFVFCFNFQVTVLFCLSWVSVIKKFLSLKTFFLLCGLYQDIRNKDLYKPTSSGFKIHLSYC